MKAIEFITVAWMVLYCGTVVRGADPSCSGTVEAVTSAASVEVAEETVFTSMSSSNGKGGVRAFGICARTLNMDTACRPANT